MNKFKLIYILDDDDLSNMLNRQFLNFSMPESTVVNFENPVDLLQNLVRNRLEVPDLMLLDISMPELNGWEFLDLCKRYGLSFDVIILSASLHLSDIEKAFTYTQVKNYIPKPLTQENIVKCIKKGVRASVSLD